MGRLKISESTLEGLNSKEEIEAFSKAWLEDNREWLNSNIKGQKSDTPKITEEFLINAITLAKKSKKEKEAISIEIINNSKDIASKDVNKWHDVSMMYHKGSFSKLDKGFKKRIIKLSEDNEYKAFTVKRTTNLLLLNDLVINKIFNADFQKYLYSEEGVNVTVNLKNKKKVEIPVKLTGIPYLTKKHQMYFNIICSIFETDRQKKEANNLYDFFTVRDVVAVLTQDNSNASKGIKEAEQYISDLASIRIKIDYSEYMRAYGKQGHCVYETYLLPLTVISLPKQGVKKGDIIPGYLLLEPPILYKMSKDVNHIINYDTEMLQVNKPSKDSNNAVNKSGNINLFIFELLKQISQQKANKGSNNGILYETILDNCNIAETDNKQRIRNKTNIIKILSNWQDKHFIEGFKLYDKKGKELPIKETMDLIKKAERSKKSIDYKAMFEKNKKSWNKLVIIPKKEKNLKGVK